MGKLLVIMGNTMYLKVLPKFLPIFETIVLCLKIILIIIISTSLKKTSGKGVA